MTVEQIIHELKPVKSITRETLYVYIRRCKIKPLGIRQRPQHYPADTATRILFKLGLANGKLKLTPKITKKSRH